MIARRLLLLLLLLSASCSKNEQKKSRTEPWENPAYVSSIAPSATGSAPVPGQSRRFKLAASKSRVSFAVPGKSSTTRGELPGASGELSFREPGYRDLAASLTFDLTTLVIRDESGNDLPELHDSALDWLEIGAAREAAVRERFRFAQFVLEDFSEQPGGSDRAPRGKVRGRLSLHGFRAPSEGEVALERTDQALIVRSRRPLSITLAEHDLRPRNARGDGMASQPAGGGSAIGREAKAEFELVFEPAH